MLSHKGNTRHGRDAGWLKVSFDARRWTYSEPHDQSKAVFSIQLKPTGNTTQQIPHIASTREQNPFKLPCSKKLNRDFAEEQALRKTGTR